MTQDTSQLKEDAIIVQPFSGYSKTKTYKLLSGGKFKEMLIPTERVRTLDSVQDFLRRHDNKIFLKPRADSRGRRAIALTKRDDAYEIHTKTERVLLSEDASASYFEQKLNPDSTKAFGRYIMQPFIDSVTQSGEPFDIRIYMQRGAGGAFTWVLVPRIGNSNGIVSNISAGGYSMAIDPFLKSEFGEMYETVYEKLEETVNTFPEYWQNLLPASTSNIGIDVGIQRTADGVSLYIFEVNSHCGLLIPDMKALRIIPAFFEYYHYLYEKFEYHL
jgi:UDP-N-acetylmuramoyl-tripeptide--D-alanyl-D-alanine ligase